MNKYMSLITVFILIPTCAFAMFNVSPASSAFTRHDAPKIVELARRDPFQFKKPTPGAPELSMTTLTFHTFPDGNFLCGAINPKSEAVRMILTAIACSLLSEEGRMNFTWVGDKIDFSTAGRKLQASIRENCLWSIDTKVIQRGNNVEFRIESVSVEVSQRQIAEMEIIAESNAPPDRRRDHIGSFVDRLLRQKREAKRKMLKQT